VALTTKAPKTQVWSRCSVTPEAHGVELLFFRSAAPTVKVYAKRCNYSIGQTRFLASSLYIDLIHAALGVPYVAMAYSQQTHPFYAARTRESISVIPKGMCSKSESVNPFG